MNRERVFCNAVITPDLKLIVFGGSKFEFSPYDAGGTKVAAIPVYEPEMLDLLNPQAGWQLLTAQSSPRLYHSVAILLKDGRIFSGSGYKDTINPPAPIPPLQHSDAEIFTPPCLQQGLLRPSIVTAIDELHYGAAIPALKVALGDPQEDPDPAEQIDFATLIRCPAVTHHADPDQRCIKLEVLSRAGNEITLASLPSQAQGGHYIAPPGYYFLFIVTTPRGNPLVRVPSVARFVRIS
jgi:galactose oxidase